MRLSLVRMVFVTVAIMLVGAVAACAENYVSWAGGFHFEIPDDWEQIDYQTVDAFLISSQAGPDALYYDAVFAPSASIPFFVGNYLIVTIDTVGLLSQTQIDSVLAEMGAIFGQDVKYFPVADVMANMKSNSPSYDAEKKLATVVNDIVHQDRITKKLVLMTRFYEKGLATFYYYSPDSLFEQSKHVVSEIVQSFSTKDLEAAAGKTDVQVADIDPKELSGVSDNDDSIPVILYIIPTFIVITIAIMAARKKRGKTQ